jgi:thioredoxin reductase (NADPH)
MPRPIILIVDDDPQALGELAEALERRYSSDYRVVAHQSAPAAIADLDAMKAQGAEIALVIADQWMKEINGIDVLVHAHELEPTAGRALLVAWGDRTAASTILHGCAFGMLDNYLYKPWTPAEVHLYPLVNEFLADWTRAARPPLELVKVIGVELSQDAHAIAEYLERAGLPYGFYPVESEQGRRLLRETGMEDAGLPVVILFDGTALARPSMAQLADAFSASGPESDTCDVAIVGAGPAGLGAAVYAASEGLNTVVIEGRTVGGQAGMSTLIRNYLGFPRGVSGAELALRAYQQAWLFGAKFVLAREVTGLHADGIDRIVTLSDGRKIKARCVVIATGASYRRLGLPHVEALPGVFYAATAVTRLMRGGRAVVVGGANSAGQSALELARWASKVTLVVRGASLEERMSDYLVREIERMPDKIDVRLRTTIIDGEGTSRLERLTLQERTSGRTQTIPADALFVFIGAQPHTEWLEGTVYRDGHGFILTGRDLEDRPEVRWPLARSPMRYETSIPGVFAVGDVRHGSVKRVASAVGEGATSVLGLHEYRGDPAPLFAGPLSPVTATTPATARP